MNREDWWELVRMFAFAVPVSLAIWGALIAFLLLATAGHP